MSTSSTSSGGRLTREMRSSRLSPDSERAADYLTRTYNVSPSTARSTVVDNPRIKELSYVIAKLLNAQSECVDGSDLHKAYYMVIENQTRMLKDHYDHLKHTSTLTRVSRHSDGSVDIDREVYQDGQEVEHDHMTRRSGHSRTEVTRRSPSGRREHEIFEDGRVVEHDEYVPPAERLSRSPMRSPPSSRSMGLTSPRRSSPALVSPPRSSVMSSRVSPQF